MFGVSHAINKKVISIESRESKVNTNEKLHITKEEFCDLINENKLSLYRLGKGILKCDADVEDAIGETILKAYKSLNSLRSRGSFKPWIMRIMANESYSIIAKKNKIDLREDLESLNLIHIDKEPSSLRELVEGLSYEFSSVIVLFYYEDMTIDEISEVLNVPKGTVKSRLSRAKDKLKLLINREEY